MREGQLPGESTELLARDVNQGLAQVQTSNPEHHLPHLVELALDGCLTTTTSIHHTTRGS